MTIKATCIWTFKERKSGVLVPVFRKKNVLTSLGLNLLASAWGGGFAPPIYLVMNSVSTQLVASYAVGVSSIKVGAQVNITGDTQIVLSIGTASQEVVTFTGVSGTGPYTYTLASPTVYAHSANDYVVRQVNQNDTIATITGEQQYDSVNAPGQRLAAVSGISQGTGNWTAQFYVAGTQAPFYITDVGLSEGATLGSGILHNHVIVGYDHTTAGNDLELDVSLTLSN